MNLVKGSLQDELDQFFQIVNKTDIEERYVSKAAFSKARANLSHTAFVAMNKSLTVSAKPSPLLTVNTLSANV